ncbi:hypothetical protein [Chitinophaga skermanii]|nr:hypothetical protein [Chitinophaga skermanii]
MNTHLNDILTLPAKGLPNVKHVDVLVSCELMNNHSKACPIEPSDQLLITQDRQGQAMLFDIDSNGVLHLFHYNDGMAGGYTAYELVKDWPSYDKVVTFDLSENRDGTISIAMVVNRRNGYFTDVLVADNIPANFEWKNFSQVVKKVTGIASEFRGTKIRIGTSDMDGHAMVVVNGNVLGNETYYRVDNRYAASQLTMSSTPSQANQVEVGYVSGQKGHFGLSGVNSYSKLAFVTIPNQAGNENSYDFSPSKVPGNLHYNCIFVGQGTATQPSQLSSDLYVGAAEGIYLFHNSKVSLFQRVNTKVKDVKSLYVTEDTHQISVWAVTKIGHLYYISGSKNGEQYTWEDEQLFELNINHLSSIRNRVKFTNEIYYVDQRKNFIHNWECPTSGFWFTRTIKQQNDPYLLGVASYTTLLKLTDQDGNILAGKTFSLSSSEWLYVEINGEAYNMDVNHPVSVTTDNRGMINIVQLTDEVLSPIFYLDAAFLDKTINVFPHGKVIDGLSNIQSADDLRKAKDINGDPILTGYHPPATLNHVVDCLRTLTGIAAYTQRGTVRKGDLFVSLSNKETKITGRLDLRGMPDFKIGIKLERGIWQLFSEDDYAKFIVEGYHVRWFGSKWWRAVKKAAAAVVDTVENAVTTVIEKVGDTVNLIINIAGDAYHFVLDTLSEVMKGIDWVLSIVKIAITDAVRWLGDFLGFKDVWTTYQVIKTLAKNGIDYSNHAIEKRLNELKNFINDEFGKIESLVSKATVPSYIASKGLSESKSHKNPFDSAAGNWIFNLIANNQLFEGGMKASSGSSGFQGFVRNTIQPAFEEIKPKLQVLINDVQYALSKDVKYYHNIVKDLINLFIAPMKRVLIGILDYIREMLQSIPTLMNGKVLPPFLDSLYRWIAALIGDYEELTILNAISFIVAIPYTYGHRILKGYAPFAYGDKGLTATSLYSTLFDPRRSGEDSKSWEDLKEAYSKGGAGIASIASMPLALLSLATSMSKSGKSNKENPSELEQIARGFQLLIPLITIPLEKDDQNTASFVLRVISFVCATMKDWFGVLIEEKMMGKLVTAVADTFIFILSLTADILNGEDLLSYLQDILSNLGGVVSSVGVLTEQIIAVGIGAGISLGGAAVGLVQSVSDDGDIVQVVNPGG